jgi:hypothetical protein
LGLDVVGVWVVEVGEDVEGFTPCLAGAGRVAGGEVRFSERGEAGGFVVPVGEFSTIDLAFLLGAEPLPCPLWTEGRSKVTRLFGTGFVGPEPTSWRADVQ